MRALRGARRRTIALLAWANLGSFVVAVHMAGALGAEQRPPAVPRPRATSGAAAPVSFAEPSAQRVASEERAAAEPAVAPAPALPIAGKGMWIYQFDRVGRAEDIVRVAVERGLTHIYVRAGTSRAGLHGMGDLAAILPAAHAAGLKVIAWYFPYLADPIGDARRSLHVLDLTVGGHRVDGFAADIETAAEGTVLTRGRALTYAKFLRKARPDRFLILVPPRPNRFTVHHYPYDPLVRYFDAVAPMVYWGRERPDAATWHALNYLRRFDRPVSPIGQAYDMGPEGGPRGAPSDGAVASFMREAERLGAVGVSFWSWQHTPGRLWRTIASFPWRGGASEV